MKTINQKKAAALLEFLQWEYAEDYMGTDDEMSDRCDHWIGELTDKELTEIVLKAFHEGI